MATINYKNGMMGGTEKDREMFYKILKELQDNAEETSGEWCGDYYVTTYKFEDGTKATYTENVELGIPHSIVIE